MDIPSGIVTFLFTDIEGSTRLAQEFQETYQSDLQKHNCILTESIESHNGFIFKRVNDAFCVSFIRPEDAANAAVEIQRRLHSGEKSDCNLKVRIGIHTGQAEFVNDDYSGYLTLSKVQRIMSVGYGGQILLSREVYDNLVDKTADEITYKDFGKRKLKDITAADNIYQLVHPDLPADFPPLKSLDVRLSNLPVELTKFIGREEEIVSIKKILADTRLLTLVGFGGTGKTRLAIRVANSLIDEFANGVWIVELSQITEPSYVLQQILSELNVTSDGKREKLEVLTDFLREKELILILDNCEHLIDECARITQSLLQKCRKLKIIATSREALHIIGEHIYQVPTLQLPDIGKTATPESLSQCESVRMFVDRATAVKTSFELTKENSQSVANLCYHLDGIPLAIELVAARVNVLTVEKIYERLNRRFELLKGGTRAVVPRQQTLKSLIDWSYDLLLEKEKLLCQRLTVFSGGCTLESSEKICSDEIVEEDEILDLLSNLLEKSLVKQVESDSNTYYVMLETIKEYLKEKLSDTEKEQALNEKHYDYFFKLIENSEEKLTGAGQREWLTKIGAENENIIAALKWSLENKPELALRMCVELGKFWELRSHFSEGLGFLQKSLEKANFVDSIWKAKAIYWTGFFLIHQGKYDDSKKLLNECLCMFREMKDRDGEAVTLLALATIGIFQDDYKNLDLFSEQSLAISRELNNKSYIARNLQNIALGFMQRGDYDEARKKFEEGLQFYREIKDSVQLAKLIGNIGALEYLLLNYDKATAAFEESLKIRQELGDRQGIAIAINNLGAVAYSVKDYDRSERLMEECLEIVRDLGDRRIAVTPLSTLGTIAVEQNNFRKAIEFFIESINMSVELGDKYTTAKGFEGFTTMYTKLNDFEMAARMAGKYITLLLTSNKNLIDAELDKIEENKNAIRSNISEEDFKKYWDEGEKMTIERGLEYVKSIDLGK